jgi:uncharacterized sporulation protein YeaH/YhbH (DUF444 family)
MIFEDLQLPFLKRKPSRPSNPKPPNSPKSGRTGVLSNLDKRRTMLENIRRNAREKGGNAKIGGFKKEDMRFKSWEEEIKVRIERRRHSDDGCFRLNDGVQKIYRAQLLLLDGALPCARKYDSVKIVFISSPHRSQRGHRRAVLHARANQGGTVVSSATSSRSK